MKWGLDRVSPRPASGRALEFPQTCALWRAKFDRLAGKNRVSIYMRVWAAAVLCTGLTACTGIAGTEFVPVQRTGAPDPSSLNAAAFDEFQKTKLPGNPQVSALREASGPQPGDWIACVKSDAPDQTARYAIFFRNNEVVASRRAVIIDKCGGDDYRQVESPLPRWPQH
jgi:hypothetical protein